MHSPIETDAAEHAAARVRDGRERILAELHKVIVGQDEVLELVLIALFTGGHCLITGVPGLAKTLLVKDARPRAAPDVQAHSSSRPT